MSQRRQLEQELFQYFNKGTPLLSNRHLAALTQESYHTVEDIFRARYDELYLANIPNQTIFEKTVNDLENIIAACNKTKVKSKSKPALIFQDETYLEHYLELLFTEKEKKILQSLINANFHHEEQEETGDTNSTTQIIAYILKGILGIGDTKNEQAVETEEYQHSRFNTWDYD